MVIMEKSLNERFCNNYQNTNGYLGDQDSYTFMLIRLLQQDPQRKEY